MPRVYRAIAGMVNRQFFTQASWLGTFPVGNLFLVPTP
jgi:hypothetical protein